MCDLKRYQITTKTIRSMGESWDESEMAQSKYGGYVEYDDAIQHIAELKAQLPKWISVDDELPSEGVSVLIYNSFGEIHTCRRPVIIDTNKSWEANTGEFSRPRITHWMAMPKPPKDKYDE